jgi:hypothetical protein
MTIVEHAATTAGAPALDHRVPSAYDALFTWDYDKGGQPKLDRLYEKAKNSMWNANELPWHLEVDPESVAVANQKSMREAGLEPDLSSTVCSTWTTQQWTQLGVENQRWMLSQFLHGEQGALLCTARIVEMAPGIDAKFYGATQVMDEARHVEVFSRYLTTKLGGNYPINTHLGSLLDDIIGDTRWDLTYLGMQIMVEGLALAAFGMMHATTTEPLLKELLHRVMADEARHVAFGVLALQDAYADMTSAELGERAEFAYEAAVLMRDRLQAQEVWARMGVDSATVHEIIANSPERLMFQQLLFSKIVPNCRKLGLLDAKGGWLRERFTELGVIAFEHTPDTAEEQQAYAVADGQ